MSELNKINNQVETFVSSMGVQIRGKRVELQHKFILLPLFYNKATAERDFLETELARANGIHPVIGQSFSTFLEYNTLVKADVRKTYPATNKELGDHNELLAVKTCASICTVYGKVHNTVRYSLRDGNNPYDPRMMNDKTRQMYMVSLVKWVKKNYEEETMQEMSRAGVPAKKACSRALDPSKKNANQKPKSSTHSHFFIHRPQKRPC